MNQVPLYIFCTLNIQEDHHACMIKLIIFRFTNKEPTKTVYSNSKTSFVINKLGLHFQPLLLTIWFELYIPMQTSFTSQHVATQTKENVHA